MHRLVLLLQKEHDQGSGLQSTGAQELLSVWGGEGRTIIEINLGYPQIQRSHRFFTGPLILRFSRYIEKTSLRSLRSLARNNSYKILRNGEIGFQLASINLFTRISFLTYCSRDRFCLRFPYFYSGICNVYHSHNYHCCLSILQLNRHHLHG